MNTDAQEKWTIKTTIMMNLFLFTFAWQDVGMKIFYIKFKFSLTSLA